MESCRRRISPGVRGLIEEEETAVDKIQLKIDGQVVTADPGMTLLEAALAHDIYIPYLCHHPDLEPVGVCRLCLVEVEGRGQTLACRAPVEEGMVVSTESPHIDLARRIAVELLLVNHDGDCLTCAQNSNCQLQQVAHYVGVDDERLARLRRREKTLPVDTSNPFFNLDHGKCVLCGICVRTCDEIVGVGALDFSFRGFNTVVGTFANKPIAESRCVSCGECVVRCPVAALVPKLFQPPSREVKTVCPYCGVGCAIYLGVRGERIVRSRGAPEGPANRGRLCVKGRFGYEFVNHPDRLTTPLIRENGKFREAPWDEALDLVAREFSKRKGDQFASTASAKCTNEDNYVIQKFTRAVMGTNSIDHCARL
jgi:formate dehydrogenase major subunit